MMEKENANEYSLWYFTPFWGKRSSSQRETQNAYKFNLQGKKTETGKQIAYKFHLQSKYKMSVL